MKWCSFINMLCSDMDEEEFKQCHCDGRCRGCEYCEEVGENEHENYN